MDVNSLYDAKHPMNLFTMEYAGVLSRAFVVEGRFSAQKRNVERCRGVRKIRCSARCSSIAVGGVIGRRRFAACADPEERDGQEVFAKGSYFSSTKGLGSHQMVFGYDGYNDRRLSNNHQSGSDYRISERTSFKQGPS